MCLNSASNGQDIIDLFCKYFSSVYSTQINTLPVTSKHIPQLSSSINKVEISLTDVFNELFSVRGGVEPNGIDAFS